MNIRVTLYQSTTYFVEADSEEQALAYVKANRYSGNLLANEGEAWSETEEIKSQMAQRRFDSATSNCPRNERGFTD